MSCIDIMRREIDMINKNNEKADKTLNVTASTKQRLVDMKIHNRETIDDVIMRLIDMYRATEPQ